MAFGPLRGDEWHFGNLAIRGPMTGDISPRKGDSVMSKPTIVKLFVGSAVAFGAGVLLAFGTVWFAYANGAFVMTGPDVTGPGGSCRQQTPVGRSN